MNTAKKVVLLVDDSLLFLERMIPILEEAENIDFVVHAGTYNEAIGLLDDLQPDLVLLDISLPDKSGIELLRHVREKHSHIQVFIMTNHASHQYQDICKKLGAHHFFDKSGDMNAVSAAIATDPVLLFQASINKKIV